MIVGEVNARREVIFSITLRDEQSVDHSFPVVLDTGFGGHLTLPPEQIARLALDYVIDVVVWVAGDVPQTVRQFEAFVIWHGEGRSIPVLEMDGEPLIGMGMVYGSDLHIHVLDGGVATAFAL